MPKYTFTAKDESGNTFTSSMEAPNKKSLRQDLKKMQYRVTSVTEEREGTAVQLPRSVRRSDIIIFTRQLATMVETGVSLVAALDLVTEETANPKMKEVALDLRSQVSRGVSLHEACSRHPKVFSEFYLGMIESSESGTSLNVVLQRVADILEKQDDTRRKVVQAFAYPTVVVVLCCLVVTYLVIFIVPVFATTYQKLGVSLPAPTKAIVGISDFVRDFWWAILGGIAVAAIAWSRIRALNSAAAWAENVRMKVPLIGPLQRKLAVSRFLRNFAVMLRSGVPIKQSLAIADSIARCQVVSTTVSDIQEAVNGGRSILDPMRQSKIFPPMVIGMAAAGEASGTMPEMFEKSADYMDADIDRAMKKLLVKLEPLITVTLAAFVGFILMAVYLPIFDVMKASH